MRSLRDGVLILILLAAPVLADPVVYQKLEVEGIPIHLVTVDLNDRRVTVTPSLTLKGRGSSETFGSIVKRTNPTAAITGTYFDTKTLLPTGDIVIEGKLVHKGVIGTAVCIDPENRVRFVPRRDQPNCGAVYDTLLGAGPTLLRGGKLVLDAKSEGFRDPALFAPASRVAIGATGHNKLLLVVVTRKIHLSELARVMAALKATDAAALDGGSSSGIYANGRMAVAPKRKLTNTLMVFVGEEQYSSARTQLAPTMINDESVTARQIRLANSSAKKVAQR